MPAVFRKLLILTLALMLLTCPALSESAGTLPGYPFPTEVEGYAFVSFADNPQLIMEADLYDISLPFLVTAEYFETVYPGCSLLQLKDFIITDGVDTQLILDMAEQTGAVPENIWFETVRFQHPFADQASFDMMLSRRYSCAFFSGAPWMAEALTRWEDKAVSYEEATAITKQAFHDHAGNTGHDMDTLTFKGSFISVLSENVRLWEILVLEPQTPYDPGNQMSNIFLVQIDADTGELRYWQWTPETQRTEFLQIIKKHTEAKQDPAGHTAAPGIPLPEGSSPLEEDPGEGEPDPDTKLYYNPDGGMFYHLDPCCPTVSPAYSPLQGWFLFSQVEDTAYRTLLPCKKCKAPKRE